MNVRALRGLWPLWNAAVSLSAPIGGAQLMQPTTIRIVRLNLRSPMEPNSVLTQVTLVLANPAVEKDGPQAALAGSLRASRSGRLSPLR